MWLLQFILCYLEDKKITSKAVCLNVVQNKHFSCKSYIEGGNLCEGGLAASIKWLTAYCYRFNVPWCFKLHS